MLVSFPLQGWLSLNLFCFIAGMPVSYPPPYYKIAKTRLLIMSLLFLVFPKEIPVLAPTRLDSVNEPDYLTEDVQVEEPFWVWSDLKDELFEMECLKEDLDEVFTP